MISVGTSQISVAPGCFRHANALIQRFSSCPLAKKLLIKVAAATNILLETGNFVTASVKLSSLSGKVILSIPAESRTTDRDPEVTNLGFELFNIQNIKRYKDVDARAEQGDIGMESYAKDMETIEAESGFGRLDLQNRCAASWKIPKPVKNPHSIDSHITTLEATLWKSEWICHTDHYREQWLDLYRSAYCQKHMEDLQSCKAKKKSLCYSKYASLSLQEKGPFLVQRLCEKFFKNAPVSLKPALEDKIRYACPQLLRESKSDL